VDVADSTFWKIQRVIIFRAARQQAGQLVPSSRSGRMREFLPLLVV
jgi:hypothetical protein